ncbi:hypothetical protein BH10ACI2_BH10ACI2_04160 [soil metagenome]
MPALYGNVLSEPKISEVRIREWLLAAKYKFARTMPENPHWYTLRKTWADDAAFVAVVEFMRANGYIEVFKGRKYTMYNLNGFKYWTMGAPINKKDGSPCTILINRARISEPADYDLIADRYDTLFIDQDSLDENREVMNMTAPRPEDRILDIGCGTGLFLRYFPHNEYVGIDPSARMLRKLGLHFPFQADSVINARFEEFYDAEGFDLIIALFGAANYIQPAKWASVCDLLRPSGRLFAMFYQEHYLPVTYEKCGVAFPHYYLSEYDLSKFTLTEYKHTFVIATYEQSA